MDDNAAKHSIDENQWPAVPVVTSPAGSPHQRAMKRVGLLFYQIAATLAAGLICGVIAAMFSISIAALLFSSVLSTQITVAIGICLVGTIVLNIVIALTSSYSGMVSSTQEITVIPLAVIASSIHAVMFATHSEAEILATVIVMVGVATSAIGLALFVMGRFRLGLLIRFIPYPVIGGFLAGMGCLIISGALSVVLGAPLTWQTASMLLAPVSLVKWLPAVAFAAIVAATARRGPLVLPVSIFVSIVIFHIVIWVLDLPLSQLQQYGWLFEPPRGGALPLPHQANPFAAVDWNVMWTQAPKMIALVCVTAMAVLSASSGIELAVMRDIDLDRELRSAGIANLCAGLFGGSGGFQGLGMTLLANQLGATNRAVGLLVAGVCAAVLFFGPSLLGTIPIPLFGGLLLWIGGVLLHEWIIGIYFKISRREYCIVLLMVIVTVTAGVLQGVTVGLIAAAILFMLEYARVDVAQNSITDDVPVIWDKGSHNFIYFDEMNEHSLVLRLQGFIFFGSIYQLYQRVTIDFSNVESRHIRFLVLDCRDVVGLDSSAIMGLKKICDLMKKLDCQLLVSGLKKPLAHQLTKVLNGPEIVLVFPELRNR
ncbi:STAS domain-containing protein [Octadecabacter sp. G9-8]|uniref:STAS domain-containing protein n=1 Tax=Octadecabacter dasysiphoniae TaxID=2909341 RepID=A0ABS9D1F4_9RHOB|nr:SulP family inorganic anion transporter [Octadecabacter dasysiphoniae]MCF2873041.1 STAS domain-containing protein [Octadecabacter dasysiphoniae]